MISFKVKNILANLPLIHPFSGGHRVNMTHSNKIVNGHVCQPWQRGAQLSVTMWELSQCTSCATGASQLEMGGGEMGQQEGWHPGTEMGQRQELCVCP